MKIAILNFGVESSIDIIDYNGDDDSEIIEIFLQNKGYNLDEINWMCSEKIEVNYI